MKITLSKVVKSSYQSYDVETAYTSQTLERINIFPK